MFLRRVIICLLTTLVAPRFADAAPIDRHALVTRHNPTITAIDKSAPFMVGNGNLAFTADITGLQTFPEQYSALVPLMTQAQWAWHSFPNPQGFTLAQAELPIKVRGKTQKYPYLSDWEQAKKPDIQWLRENPHRFSLGRLGLYLEHRRQAGGVQRHLRDSPDARPVDGPAFEQLRVRRRAGGGGDLRPSGSRSHHRAPAVDAAVRWPARCRSQVSRRRREAESGSGGLGTSRDAFDARDGARRRRTHARAPARRHALHGARGGGSRARHHRPRGARVPPHGAGVPAAHLVSGVLRKARRPRRCPSRRSRAMPWPAAGKTSGCMAAWWTSPAAAIRAPRNSSAASCSRST